MAEQLKAKLRIVYRKELEDNMNAFTKETQFIRRQYHEIAGRT